MIALGAIYAHCPGGGIGYRGRIHWKYPADIEHFWKTIGNVPVIVGYETWKGAEKYFAKNRTGCRHIVITRHAKSRSDSCPFVRFVDSKEKALEAVYVWEGAAWVCGGASIYKLFLNDCDIFVGTKIPQIYRCDRFLPWGGTFPPNTTRIWTQRLWANSSITNKELPCDVSYLASHGSLLEEDFDDKLRNLNLGWLADKRTEWH